MKRDMDLVREILIELEDSEATKLGIHEVRDTLGHSEHEVSEHVALLLDASLVKGEVIRESGSDPDSWILFRLTWEGHEFLAAARDAELWAKAKHAVRDAAGSLGFALLKEFLLHLSREKLGLSG